jgi:CheY-like chemotaxis protein
MIKAVLIDDERPALRAMEYLLKDNKLIEISAVFTDPLEAINKIKEIMPQIVFLDINMPQLQGIDVASRILDICPNDHTKIGLRFGDMGIINFMFLQAMEPKDNIFALIKFIEVNIPVPLWYFMLFVSFGMYAARISVEQIKDTVADIARNLN